MAVKNAICYVKGNRCFQGLPILTVAMVTENIRAKFYLFRLLNFNCRHVEAPGFAALLSRDSC